MNKKFILPDFDNSILNVSATLAEFLGCENKNTTLAILKKELQKNYKNIICICFDGLGIHPIGLNLPQDDFLRKNIKQTIKSTFPSTTTCATTSINSNRYPLEYGWLGWSVYFENINKVIEVFLDTDAWTGEKYEIAEKPIEQTEFYFDSAKTDYQINTVLPKYVKVKNHENNNVYETPEQFFDFLQNICQREQKQFCYAYYPEPDHTMHESGASSEQAKQLIQSISKSVENLYNNTKDTLFVIFADHGHADVTGYIEIYKDEQIMDMLEIYPYLDGRAVAFKVKPQYKQQFPKLFEQKYGEDFEIFESKKLIDMGFFGKSGNKHNLLGDYIAIGTFTHKQMLLTPRNIEFKSHHTALTEEMEVPLILISN